MPLTVLPDGIHSLKPTVRAALVKNLEIVACKSTRARVTCSAYKGD